MESAIDAGGCQAVILTEFVPEPEIWVTDPESSLVARQPGAG